MRVRVGWCEGVGVGAYGCDVRVWGRVRAADAGVGVRAGRMCAWVWVCESWIATRLMCGVWHVASRLACGVWRVECGVWFASRVVRVWE